ncbi:peroxidase [Prevotella aurantiaca]|uniref:peroxidase n=1 Tax=Prevotella aurantiaca TaxID=596085 RepID=UPI0028DCE84C|nr:peroxidase [Prevotella aurantiaca]
MKILEQLKAIIEKEVLNESSKDFYLREISELNKEKQQEIINLVERMEEAGFKNNLASAFSEVTEDIPQFARMMVFKELHKISRNVEVNCDYACDLDESGDWESLKEKFNKSFSKEDAEKFLRIYTKGVVARFYDFLEEGNPRAEEDDLNWVLLETKEDGSHSERVIQGFWEDDFEEDDFDWDREED